MDIASAVVVGLGGASLGTALGLFLSKEGYVINANVFIVALLIFGVGLVLVGSGLNVENNPLTMWLLIGLGILVVVGGGVYFYRSYSRREYRSF